MWRGAMLFLAACGRVAFDPQAMASDADIADAPPVDAAPLPLHHYRFAGNLNDDRGGPPLTAVMPGSFVSAGYQFMFNGGVSLPAASFPSAAYTIDVTFSFDEVTGWRKIFDASDLVLDRGLYIYNAALQVVIVPNGQSMPDFLTSGAIATAGVALRLTLTRDASGVVTAYINGAPVAAGRSNVADVPTITTATSFSYSDTMGVFATPSPVAWFVDDAATGSEAASGVVQELVIWDRALSAAEL